MSTAASVLHGVEAFILVYFAILSLSYALTALIGLRSVVVASRELSPVALKDLVDRKFYKPISILVPAYNEEEGIAQTIWTLLTLRYPEFEVIVSVDGATDATLARIVTEFAMVEVPRIYRLSVATQPVRRVFRSSAHPRLTVLEKENGGRADAINAALNVARFPLMCVVDADSLLDPEALARASRRFIDDDTVVAVGGALRPLNGATVEHGAIVDNRAPRRWVERVQLLEYARSFFVSRVAWSRVGSLMIVSGAFGIFRRDVVIQVGGWSRGFVADDFEMVVNLHRRLRELGQRYRIDFTPEPLCWTEVPSRLRDLRAQRAMWERGVVEVLWRHRRMAFNPRYGRIGLVGIPYLWFFETGATVVETLGYLTVVVSLALGLIDVGFTLLFFTLAVLFGALFSELGMTVEGIVRLTRRPAVDRLVLFLAGFAEYVGIRQVVVFTRALALFQVRSRRGRYWAAAPAPPTPAASSTPAPGASAPGTDASAPAADTAAPAAATAALAATSGGIRHGGR